MICTLIVATLTAVSAPDALEQARQTARFAEHLSQKGDHYRAIGELERALFLAPDAPESTRWSLDIGEAYRLGEQYETAARHFEHVAETRPEARAVALLGAAQSWQGAGRHESAIARAREAAESFGPGTDDARKARYVEGWSLLLSTDRDADERDRQAAEAFRLARGEGPVGEGASQLLNVLPQLEHLPHRSPIVAGALGLIPGFGHFYIGDVGTGLSALMWNGLFGWALYEAIRAKNYSLAVVLGLFEVMWYGGSITGAIGGAHRFNRDARLNAMDDLGRLSSPTLLDDVVRKSTP